MNIKERKSRFNERTKTISIDEFYEYEEAEGQRFDDYLDEKVAPLVGMTAIVFNSLESALDFILSDMIDQDNDEIGWVVIKSMSFSQKTNLLIDLIRANDDWVVKFSKDEISNLRESLKHAGSLRNSIIHGEWESMSKDYRVKTKINVGDDGVIFKMTEFLYEDLEGDVDFIDDRSVELWKSPKFKFK